MFSPPKFKCIPFISGPKIQTALGTFLPSVHTLEDERCELVPTTHNDKLLLFKNTPKEPNSESVLLVHGLGGSHQSNDCTRLGAKLFAMGYTIYRMNLRGAGIGHKFASKTYHAGLSEDVHSVIKHIGDSKPLILIGISLGGNLVLKTLAEHFYPHIRTGIAVCPPIELQKTADYLCKEENYLFNRYFTLYLKAHLKNFDTVWFTKAKDLKDMHEYDSHITSPMWNFPDARTYYQTASSGPILSQVRTPTLIIGAEDDPIVDHMPLLKHRGHPFITQAIAPYGGHVGFISMQGRWMDQVLLEWLDSPKLRNF